MALTVPHNILLHKIPPPSGLNKTGPDAAPGYCVETVELALSVCMVFFATMCQYSSVLHLEDDIP